MLNKRTYRSLFFTILGSFLLQFNAVGADAPAEQPSESELIEKLGYMTVIQAGMHDLGFTVEDADAIAAGIRKGLQDEQPSAEMLERMPAFQTFIQAKIAEAEAKMSERNAELAAGNAAEADAFFAKLKEVETVLSLESGLHYKVLEA